MKIRLLFLLLHILFFRPSLSNYDRPTDILKKLLTNYKKSEPPRRDKATEVELGIYINSFYSINEQTMDYSVSMYLRQQWVDPRLSYAHLSNFTKPFKMADLSWNLIWLPDTFFRNEKAATFHKVTVNNRMLRLTKDGTLWYVVKITAVLSCPMNLQFYPLDTQVCPLMFESFGYTKDVLTYSWLSTPVELEESLQLPQYTIDNNFLTDCAVNYTGGQFPCLQVSFRLRREIGYYLIQVYVPSVLIVILSWVSFWIHVEASPARVSIGLLTVLTTTTMSAGARATLPRVSYIKALDVWMIACLIFVFAGLIEYAIVNVVARGKTAEKHSSGMDKLKNSFKRGIGGLKGSFRTRRRSPKSLKYVGAPPRLAKGERCEKGPVKMGLQTMYRKRRSFTRPRESLIEIEEKEQSSGMVENISVIKNDETWVKKEDENDEKESVVIKIGNKIFEGSLRHKTTLQPLLKNQQADSQQQQYQQQHQQQPQPQLYIRKQGSYNDAFDDAQTNEQQQNNNQQQNIQHHSQQKQLQRYKHQQSIETNVDDVEVDDDQIPSTTHPNVKKLIKQSNKPQQRSSLILRQQNQRKQQEFQNRFQAQNSENIQMCSKQQYQKQQFHCIQHHQLQHQHSTTSQNKHVTFTSKNKNNNYNKNNNNNNLPETALTRAPFPLDDSEMSNTYEECSCPCCGVSNVSVNRCRRFFRKLKPPCCNLPSDGKKKASKVDKISRRLFPCLFLFFNLVYWCFYTANHDS